MAKEWNQVILEDICELIVDCVNRTAPTANHVTPYRMIRTSNIKGGRIDLTDVKYVTEDVFDIWTRRGTPQVGDVVLTREAPLGEVGLIRENNIFLGQRLMMYRANPKVLDNKFLLYALMSEELQHQIKALGSGSTVEHMRVPDAKLLAVKLPPLEEQRAIAHVLGSLDDKIEANRRQNQTLEAMARALFQSWFVDFDPVHAKARGETPIGMDAETAALFPSAFTDSPLGPIPEGWEVAAIEDVFEINPSRSLKKGEIAPYLPMKHISETLATPTDIEWREYTSGMRFMNGDTLLARITPCLENGKTAFVDFLDDDAIGWGSTEYIVLRSKPPIPLGYTYFLARSPDFRAFAISNMTGTSGRQRVETEALRQYPIVTASEAIYNVFGELTDSLMLRSQASHRESYTLSQIRDLLLPKLISGEIRVEDVDVNAGLDV